jgi:hypothetical protein
MALIKKLNKISSLLLLVVFLLPSIVKLEHHHEHFHCDAKGEKHYHVHHEKCAICSFEFSVFLSGFSDIVFTKENPFDNYCNNYNSVYFSNLSQYSFLLRAPPILTNSI